MKTRLIPMLLLATMLACQSEAHAEEPSPSEKALLLGHEGLALYQAGKWADALERFEQASEAMYSPVFLLYVARCQRNLDRLREAAAALDELLRRAPAGDAPVSWANAVRDARGELEALRRRIPSLSISADGVASATVDDAPAQLGEPLPLNPGKHVVRGWSVDGRLASRTIWLREGEREGVTIVFAVVPKPRVLRLVPPAQQPESTGPRNPWRTAAWLTGGAAIASAVVGTVTGLVAKSRTDSIRAHCTGSSCPADLEDDAGRARLLANVSSAAFGVAGLNLAFGVTFVFLPPWPAETRGSDRR